MAKQNKSRSKSSFRNSTHLIVTNDGVKTIHLLPDPRYEDNPEETTRVADKNKSRSKLSFNKNKSRSKLSFRNSTHLIVTEDGVKTIHLLSDPRYADNPEETTRVANKNKSRSKSSFNKNKSRSKSSFRNNTHLIVTEDGVKTIHLLPDPRSADNPEETTRVAKSKLQAKQKKSRSKLSFNFNFKDW